MSVPTTSDDLAARFKGALSRFPSGVVIATTRDAEGAPAGFTASSFSSVSLAPPIVLVCLATSARSHAPFSRATRYAINILRPGHEALAKKFADSRIADKFDGGEFVMDGGGLPRLADSHATLMCRAREFLPCGDHSVMIGEVEEAVVGDAGEVMIYYNRRFWTIGGPEIDLG
jgi:flavin reductase ActVB